jgi:hypothetical protein
MARVARYFLFVVCAGQLVLAVVCFAQWPLASSIWPFAGTTPLTFIFVSSILAAAAASMFWVAASQTYGALAGLGVDYVAVLVPLSVLSLRGGATSGGERLTALGFMCGVGAVFGLVIFLWGIRVPVDQSVRMPAPVRWSFVGFVLALLVVSTRLLLGVTTIPWTITPVLSQVIAWMFLGAATYFVYALVRPSWLNAAGQLAGFLAYDLVLIVPFLTRLPTTSPQHMVGLVVYTAVVIYSGLLASYYLFIHKPTRVWT